MKFDLKKYLCNEARLVLSKMIEIGEFGDSEFEKITSHSKVCDFCSTHSKTLMKDVLLMFTMSKIKP